MLSNVQLTICLLLMIYLGKYAYHRLVWDVLRGNAFAAFFDVLLISAGSLLFLAKYGENRDITDFFDLSVMPWSLVGDIFVVAPAFAAAAMAWRSRPLLDEQRFFDRQWWSPLCGVIGLASGVTFHTLDSNAYRAMGASELITSFTKVVHDTAIIAVLVAALLRVGVPLLMGLSWLKLVRWRWLFLALVVAQITLMAIDANRGLDPHNFHLPCDMRCGSDNLTDHVMGWTRAILRQFDLIE